MVGKRKARRVSAPNDDGEGDGDPGSKSKIPTTKNPDTFWKSFHCRVCSYRASTHTALKKHQDKHKNNTETETSPQTPHYCKVCNFSARSRYEFENHTDSARHRKAVLHGGTPKKAAKLQKEKRRMTAVQRNLTASLKKRELPKRAAAKTSYHNSGDEEEEEEEVSRKNKRRRSGSTETAGTDVSKTSSSKSGTPKKYEKPDLHNRLRKFFANIPESESEASDAPSFSGSSPSRLTADSKDLDSSKKNGAQPRVYIDRDVDEKPVKPKIQVRLPIGTLHFLPPEVNVKKEPCAIHGSGGIKTEPSDEESNIDGTKLVQIKKEGPVAVRDEVPPDRASSPPSKDLACFSPLSCITTPSGSHVESHHSGSLQEKEDRESCRGTDTPIESLYVMMPNGVMVRRTDPAESPVDSPMESSQASEEIELPLSVIPETNKRSSPRLQAQTHGRQGAASAQQRTLRSQTGSLPPPKFLWDTNTDDDDGSEYSMPSSPDSFQHKKKKPVSGRGRGRPRIRSREGPPANTHEPAQKPTDNVETALKVSDSTCSSTKGSMESSLQQTFRDALANVSTRRSLSSDSAPQPLRSPVSSPVVTMVTTINTQTINIQQLAQHALNAIPSVPPQSQPTGGRTVAPAITQTEPQPAVVDLTDDMIDTKPIIADNEPSQPTMERVPQTHAQAKLCTIGTQTSPEVPTEPSPGNGNNQDSTPRVQYEQTSVQLVSQTQSVQQVQPQSVQNMETMPGNVARKSQSLSKLNSDAVNTETRTEPLRLKILKDGQWVTVPSSQPVKISEVIQSTSPQMTLLSPQQTSAVVGNALIGPTTKPPVTDGDANIQLNWAKASNRVQGQGQSRQEMYHRQKGFPPAPTKPLPDIVLMNQQNVFQPISGECEDGTTSTSAIQDSREDGNHGDKDKDKEEVVMIDCDDDIPEMTKTPRKTWKGLQSIEALQTVKEVRDNPLPTQESQQAKESVTLTTTTSNVPVDVVVIDADTLPETSHPRQSSNSHPAVSRQSVIYSAQTQPVHVQQSKPASPRARARQQLFPQPTQATPLPRQPPPPQVWQPRPSSPRSRTYPPHIQSLRGASQPPRSPGSLPPFRPQSQHQVHPRQQHQPSASPAIPIVQSPPQKQSQILHKNTPQYPSLPPSQTPLPSVTTSQIQPPFLPPPQTQPQSVTTTQAPPSSLPHPQKHLQPPFQPPPQTQLPTQTQPPPPVATAEPSPSSSSQLESFTPMSLDQVETADLLTEMESRGFLQMCVCGMGFTDPALFQRHRRFHSSWNPFQCEVCTKKFRTQLTFARHLVKHCQ